MYFDSSKRVCSPLPVYGISQEVSHFLISGTFQGGARTLTCDKLTLGLDYCCMTGCFRDDVVCTSRSSQCFFFSVSEEENFKGA